MVFSKKSQITMFILIGIIIIALFTMVIKARNEIIQKKLQLEAENTVSDFLQTNSINYYVDSCLQRVLEQQLKKFAARGGFKNITGNLGEDYLTYDPWENGTLVNVTYGLVPNKACSAIAGYQNTSLYPYPQTKLSNLTHSFYGSKCFHQRAARSGFYGYQSIPGMCEPLGQNSYQWIGNTSIWLWCAAGDTDFSNNSIQKNIQEEMSKEIVRCVNFSIYEQKGHNITLDKENVSTALIYGFDSTSIIVQFPFKVNIRGKQPIIVKRKFDYKSNIRFRKVYEFIARLLFEEANKLYFNGSMLYTALPEYDPLFIVNFTKNACTTCPSEAVYDDVLQVTDLGSLIDNKPLIFRTAIRDRQPALDYIHSEDAGTRYDIKILQNQSLTIKPEGYDPDDTAVKYYYEGWRQDYDSEFNFTCCEQANRVTDPDCAGCVKKIPVRNKSRRWMNSTLFKVTKKDAKIETNESDTGPHIVTLKVISEGKQDFQDVKVLVFDLPKAIITLKSLYPGLNPNITSKEDQYTLDASDSRISMIQNEPISKYFWYINYINPANHNKDEEARIATSNSITTIPEGVWEDANLLNYPEYSFKKAGDYELKLQVATATLISEPQNISIKSYDCIPYRKKDINVYPYNGYPYVTLSSDPTTYNHTCCQGRIAANGNLEGPNAGKPFDSSKKCFQADEFGPLPYFSTRDPKRGLEPPARHIEIELSAPSLPTITKKFNNKDFNYVDYYKSLPLGYQNDVFKRHFERKCDGTRGNICSGDIEETITIEDSCADWELGADERCEYPSTSGSCSYNFYSLTNKNCSDDEQCYSGVCVENINPDGSGRCLSPLSSFEIYANYSNFNFPGITFKDRNGKNPDGICNPTFVHTNTWGSTDLDPNGKLKCQLGCGGGACNRAVNCECDTSNGAEADKTSPKHVYDTSNPKQPICKYNPDVYPSKDNPSPSCAYEKELCYKNCTGDQYGSSCQARKIGLKQTCYYDPNPCKDEGCVLTQSYELRDDYCDQCTETGYLEGEYCPEPGTMEEGICYYGTRSCGGAEGTKCGLSIADSKVICDLSTQVAHCDPDNGVVCKYVAGQPCEKNEDCDSGVCEENLLGEKKCLEI